MINPTIQSAAEFQVRMAPADRIWDSVVVERFNGSKAEAEAAAMADSLQGLENTTVYVSMTQCM